MLSALRHAAEAFNPWRQNLRNRNADIANKSPLGSDPMAKRPPMLIAGYRFTQPDLFFNRAFSRFMTFRASQANNFARAAGLTAFIRLLWLRRAP
jgi:hypothetical protein